jgi:hypothetical protein
VNILHLKAAYMMGTNTGKMHTIAKDDRPDVDKK